MCRRRSAAGIGEDESDVAETDSPGANVSFPRRWDGSRRLLPARCGSFARGGGLPRAVRNAGSGLAPVAKVVTEVGRLDRWLARGRVIAKAGVKKRALGA